MSKLFVDSANFTDIRRLMQQGICDGVTTNPAIVAKAGRVWPGGAVEIAALIHPLPLSLEVTTDEVGEMIVEARSLNALAPNVVVKIPVTNSRGESCLGVILSLSAEGIAVNATACMTFMQLTLAAKAGARYVSLFCGRVDDEGGDACDTIRAFVATNWDSDAELIAASVRTTANVSAWMRAGADIVTVSPAIVDKLLVHGRTMTTVAEFVAAGRTLGVLRAEEVR